MISAVAGRWGWASVVLASLLAVVAIGTDAVPLLRGPAPYPPEWQWEYRPAPDGAPWLPGLATGAALLGLVALTASPWASRRPQIAGAVVLAAVPLVGWAHQLALLEMEPGGALRTLIARTTSRSYSSYHTVALSDAARAPREFLRQHAELLPELRASAKHAATHPPGPVLYYRGLIALCEASPGLTRRTLALLGEEPDRPTRPPQTPESRAAALLGALLLGLLGASAAMPLAVLALGLTGDTLAAARAGAVWCLLPGPALMTPQLDQALAFAVAGSAAGLAVALSSDRPLVPALLAGTFAALALFISYGAAVFLAVAVVAALAIAGRPGTSRVGSVLAAAAAVPFAGLLLLLLAGHEPLRSLRTALAIHREAYTQPRDYALWLAFNPVDLLVFLGVPVSLLFAAAAVRSCRAALREQKLATAADRLACAAAASLALLLVSGVTRGEVGRLWLPLMPFLLLAALVEPASGGATARLGWARPLLAGALLLPLDLAIRAHWRL